MNYKKFAQRVINQHLVENKDDFELFPTFKGFMLSAHGIPRMILESEDSTMILDMDETLVHTPKLSPKTLQAIQNNSEVLTYPKDLDKEEIKPYAESHVDEFKEALKSYKYKDYVDIRPHKVYGYSLIVHRPFLEDFLDELESLVGSKDLKDVIVYTANPEWWAKELVSSVNQAYGKNLKLYADQDLHPDSMIADDNENSAKIKLLKAKVIDKKDFGVTPSQWVRVNEFRGDFKDDELKTVIKAIQGKV